MKSDLFTVGKLFVWAEEGNPAKLEEISPTLNMNKHVFSDDAEYPAIEIDTPLLTPITEDTPKTGDLPKANRRNHGRPKQQNPSC